MCNLHVGFHLWIHSVMAELFPLTLKNCTENVVYHIAMKGYEVESRNFIGMLVSMCYCAPEVLLICEYNFYIHKWILILLSTNVLHGELSCLAQIEG